MQQIHWIKYAGVALLVALAQSAHPAGARASDAEQSSESALHFGGCGGVYFLVEPGEFWVEVEKQDLNRKNRTTFLRAILVGPDRTVLEDVYIPDVEGPEKGPVQRIRLTTHAGARGIYALNITVTQDRYGEDIAWGFRTNCRHYLVETSRGHRDAAHEEPLVLRSPEQPGEVCFRPEQRAFSLEVTGLSTDAAPPMLYDARDRQIAVITPDEAGTAQHVVPADVPRDAVPWRLKLASFQATVHIDGVTRWPEGSDFPDFPLWTPHRDSWFPVHANRWLITPYSKVVYDKDAAPGTAAFEVHNNAQTPRTFDLNIEHPGPPWPVELAKEKVTVPARRAIPVSLTYTIPEEGDAWTCHVRVTPRDTPDVSTYATLVLRRGTAPATEPLPVPLVLKPYRHENALFGYRPTYPLTNQIYFDTDNRPFITSESGVHRLCGEQWAETKSAVLPDGQTVPLNLLSSKVAFDSDNGVYLIARAGGRPALLHSNDKGATFRAYPLPVDGKFDIAQFSGHNTPDGPPPLVCYTLTERDPDRIWRRLNDLHLLLPEKDGDGNISIPDPVRLSSKCIGFSAHSGIPSSVISRDGKVHVAWGEATDPDKDVEGVPTYAVTYDRNSGTLGKPALVGYGPPANDVHNTPSITMDSTGHLHVLIGTHGRTFRYARSRQSHDAGDGWTDAEEIGPGLRQTYVGMVCSDDDTVHAVFRLWNDDRQYFPAYHYATLSYMRKSPGEPWSDPQPLVVAPFSGYSIFYHRLTIDRDSTLYLSYDYWSTYWFYRNDHRGTRRALMMSPDAGDSWRLANMDDLQRQ
ncbi:MAG: BNR-4 repeat-containing protein [Candidatus Hydrogenedentota bacterium]